MHTQDEWCVLQAIVWSF